MTAPRWANHCCALCLVTTGERTPALESWPYLPLCRAHIIASGGTVKDTVIDFRAARARLRSPSPTTTVAS